MVDSTKKWKYLSIGSLVMLAVGFSFPQAFAHVTNNLSNNVGHILEILTVLQSSVNDVKAKTDQLPSDLASNTAISNAAEATGLTKTVVIDKLLPVPAAAPEIFEVIPPQAGKTYSGHLTLTFQYEFQRFLHVGCSVNDSSIVIGTLGDLGGPVELNTGFACEGITIVVLPPSAPPSSQPDRVLGVVQFVESSDVIELD